MQKKNKKIVSIFVPYIQIGGGPMGYVYNMLQGLKKIGDSEKLKINFIGIDCSRYKKATYPKEFLQKGFRFLYRNRIAVRRYFALLKSDICVFQGYQNPKYENIAKKRGKICIYMPHSPSIMADEQKMMWMLENKTFDDRKYKENYDNEKLLFESADYIVFPSKNSADSYFSEWKEIITTKKVIYLKSGVIKRDSKNINDLRSKFKDKKIVAFCGRYVTHKGFDLFCDVADTFKNDARVVFVCFGTGALGKNNFKHNVIDMGFTSDIGTVFNNVDLILIPNRIAYYDLLPIECASYGKPMVLSAVGGNIDQAEDFPDTLTFSSCNINDFHNQIQNALSRLSEDSSWGVSNKVAYEKEFTEIKFIQRWLDFFESISIGKTERTLPL